MLVQLSPYMRAAPMRATRPEQGFVLIVVLLLLLILTLLGLSAALLSLQAEQSVRYDRDYWLARQSAELALDDAEDDIQHRRNDYLRRHQYSYLAPGCSTLPDSLGICPETPIGQTPSWLTAFTDLSHTVRYGQITGKASLYLADAPGTPHYIIEPLTDPQGCAADTQADLASTALPCTLLRLTTWAKGPAGKSHAVLQTLYRLE